MNVVRYVSIPINSFLNKVSTYLSCKNITLPNCTYESKVKEEERREKAIVLQSKVASETHLVYV